MNKQDGYDGLKQRRDELQSAFPHIENASPKIEGAIKHGFMKGALFGAIVSTLVFSVLSHWIVERQERSFAAISAEQAEALEEAKAENQRLIQRWALDGAELENRVRAAALIRCVARETNGKALDSLDGLFEASSAALACDVWAKGVAEFAIYD